MLGQQTAAIMAIEETAPALPVKEQFVDQLPMRFKELKFGIQYVGLGDSGEGGKTARETRPG